MKKISLFTTLFTCITLLHLNLSAQGKLSIENVYKAYLRKSGPIISNEEIKGYYLFYQTDKIDRKTNEYTLQILDDNLNKVKDIEFTDSKNVFLKEGSFNGTDLMFVFYNDDTRTLTYRAYGVDGSQKYSYDRELDKKTVKYMESDLVPMNAEKGSNNSLFSVDNKGFISLIRLRDDGNYSYEVSFYQTNKKNSWSFSPDDDVKFSQATFIGNTDSIALFQVLKKESMLSGKVHPVILGLNLENGKKAFEFETVNQNTFYPMNIGLLQNSNNYILIGPYYNAGDNVMKDNSLGLAVWEMNNQGKIINQKYSSWSEQLSKFVTVDSKGKVEDVGYIFFHKIMQTEDGKIFAIGEGYKKVVSALGSASKLLMLAGGSGMSAFKLKITNFIMIQLNSDYKIADAKIYEKNSNTMEMPAGAEFMGPHLMALWAKQYGYFDYSYTQTDKSHSTFVVGYSDYVRSDDYKGGTFNTITYYDGKFSTDKINLKSDASDVYVMPGKTGNVVLVEYFKKEKRLDVHIEKVN